MLIITRLYQIIERKYRGDNFGKDYTTYSHGILGKASIINLQMLNTLTVHAGINAEVYRGVGEYKSGSMFIIAF